MAQLRDVMTSSIKTVAPDATAQEAANFMLSAETGSIPVTENDRVVGMITDRDICMAAAMSDKNPSGISVEEVMTGLVYSLNPEDEIDDALKVMQEHKIRRLPVVNAQGELEGILSMNDVVLNAKATGDDIAYGDVVQTYQAICERPLAASATAAV